MEPSCNVGIVKDATVGIMASPRRLGSAVVRRHPIPVVLFLSLPDLTARFARDLSADVKRKPGTGQRNSADQDARRGLPLARARDQSPWGQGVEKHEPLYATGRPRWRVRLAIRSGRAARAQAKFPDRPIRLIIPWAAGGPADAGFRILAQSVSKKLGQQVIVDNKAGASGIMGAMALQEAKPDGYTISQMHMSVLRQPLLNKQLTYNPINDLTYILQITGFVMGVVVRADAPWKTLPELLAYAKANPAS